MTTSFGSPYQHQDRRYAVEFGRCWWESFVVAALLTFFLGAAAFAEPIVNEREVHYDIHGDTAAGLLRQLNAERGTDGFHAETRWYASWRIGWQSTENGCQIVDVRIKVDIEYLLPRWQDLGENSNRRLVDRWKRYERALRHHERGHGQIGIEAGREVEAELHQMSPRHDCERLSADADALAKKIIDEHHQRDKDYDRVTEHGATQGAIFR